MLTIQSDRQALYYFVKFMLESTERLDVICYASLHKGLPSWVPYWGPIAFGTLDVFSLSSFPSAIWSKLPMRFPGQRQANSFAPLRHRDVDSFLKRITLDEKFSAAGDSKAEARIEQMGERPPVLIANGCIIDEITGFLRGPESRNLVRNGDKLPLPNGESTIPAEYSYYSERLGKSSKWLKSEKTTVRNEEDVKLSDLIKQMLARFLRLISRITYRGC